MYFKICKVLSRKWPYNLQEIFIYRNNLKNPVALVMGQLTFPTYNKIKNVNTKSLVKKA